jgi:hypothetical protein
MLFLDHVHEKAHCEILMMVDDCFFLCLMEHEMILNAPEHAHEHSVSEYFDSYK